VTAGHRADVRLRALVWTSGALAAGSAAMAVAHSGVEIPLLSALGPGGSRAVVPAAIAFSVATVLHTLVTVGVRRRRSWAWPLGIAVAALTLVGAAFPYRGAVSAIGIALAVVELALLLTPQARMQMLRATS
jgi:hypothetical protein